MAQFERIRRLIDASPPQGADLVVLRDGQGSNTVTVSSTKFAA